jgi:hypothetical protein
MFTLESREMVDQSMVSLGIRGRRCVGYAYGSNPTTYNRSSFGNDLPSQKYVILQGFESVQKLGKTALTFDKKKIIIIK